MATLPQVIAELRRFEHGKEVVKQLRKRMREPVPAVRRAIKQRAMDTLPKRGGLNAWVAKTRITAAIKLSSRSVSVKLRGGRNSKGSRSDIRAIDRGRVRAPSWGRRTKGQWHNQTVEEGFFTKPTSETNEWRNACVRAADDAVRSLGRG